MGEVWLYFPPVRITCGLALGLFTTPKPEGREEPSSSPRDRSREAEPFAQSHRGRPGRRRHARLMSSVVSALPWEGLLRMGFPGALKPPEPGKNFPPPPRPAASISCPSQCPRAWHSTGCGQGRAWEPWVPGLSTAQVHEVTEPQCLGRALCPDQRLQGYEWAPTGWATASFWLLGGICVAHPMLSYTTHFPEDVAGGRQG